MLLKDTKDFPEKHAAPFFGEDTTWEELLLTVWADRANAFSDKYVEVIAVL